MIKENKFTKYLLYAFGEIMLVVIGILIALEVNNWNNERLDKNKAQLLMNHLIVNLQNDQMLMNTMSNYYAVVKKYSISAIDGFNEISSISDEQFVIAAYQASQFVVIGSNRSAYTEMISTGKIDLIKNDEIKEQILRFYNLDWSQFLISEAPYREYIRELIPFNIQDAIRSNCGDIPFYIENTYAYKLPESCDLQLPDALFKQTAIFLRSQTDLLKKLRYQVAMNEIKTFSLDSNNKRTLKLLAEVKAYKP